LNLVITADPGARAHFIAAWLQNQLISGLFDVGTEIIPKFTKLHNDWANEQVLILPGRKIRVQPSYHMLYLHMYLFLIKNVYPQIPTMNRDQFSFDVANKMIESGKEWFYHDQQIDIALYDRTMTFADTFDRNYMIDLYQWYNNSPPTEQYIQILNEINNNNQIILSKNHSCNVSAMILEKEHRLGLREIERFWSLSDIYSSVEIEQLYDTIADAIHKDNYGRSDKFAVGINEMTAKL
jgi:hypothetical protein